MSSPDLPSRRGPSRFIAQLHPHFREVMQVLAIQAADEATTCRGVHAPRAVSTASSGLLTVGGQASLRVVTMVYGGIVTIHYDERRARGVARALWNQFSLKAVRSPWMLVKRRRPFAGSP